MSTSSSQGVSIHSLSILLTIWPKTGPFRGGFWTIRFSTFCTKTHFPENQKSWPKALWEVACESGSEFHKHPWMCERGEWRKQLREFITQSLNKPPLAQVQTIPLGVTFSNAQSSKLERLFCHVLVKRDVQALSFELWNSIRKCHPKWDWLYLFEAFLV